MELRFSKKEDGHHLMTVIRDNGSVTRGHVVPGFGAQALPHDLTHALVEKHLHLTRGVFGLLNTGISVDDLMTYGKRAVNAHEPELTFSEAAAAEIQHLLAGVPSAVIVLSIEDREAIATEARHYENLWKQLPVGETLTMAFPL